MPKYKGVCRNQYLSTHFIIVFLIFILLKRVYVGNSIWVHNILLFLVFILLSMVYIGITTRVHICLAVLKNNQRFDFLSKEPPNLKSTTLLYVGTSIFTNGYNTIMPSSRWKYELHMPNTFENLTRREINTQSNLTKRHNLRQSD